MIYILIQLIVANLFLLSEKDNNFTKKKNSNVYKILIFEILVLFAGLRNYSVGLDTNNYLKNYTDIDKRLTLSTTHPFEFLYQLLNFVVALCFDDAIGFQLVLIINTAILVFNYLYVTDKISSNKLLSLMLFYSLSGYLSSFNQLRQVVAISFLVMASLFAYKKQPFKYLLFVIIAFLFHKSTIIFLPTYFIFNCNNKKILYILYGFTISLFVIVCCYFDNIVNIVNKVVTIDYFNKYTNYKSYESLNVSTMIKIVGSVILCIAIFLRTFFVSNHKDKISMLQLNYFLCLSCLLYVLGIFKGNLIMRFVPVFYWVLMFLLPQLVNSFKSEKIKHFLTISMFIATIVYTGLITEIKDIYGINPYKLYFVG